MSDKEDYKEAVNIGVTLSGQIITAALAMIAVLGAFSTYILDKREVGWAYFVFIFISGTSFVASIIYGGAGINKARRDGFTGKWEIDSTKNLFNSQAILSLVGVVFFTFSTTLGKAKPETLEKDTINSSTRSRLNEYYNFKNSKAIIELQKRVDKLTIIVDSLEQRAKNVNLLPTAP